MMRAVWEGENHIFKAHTESSSQKVRNFAKLGEKIIQLRFSESEVRLEVDHNHTSGRYSEEWEACRRDQSQLPCAPYRGMVQPQVSRNLLYRLGIMS